MTPTERLTRCNDEWLRLRAVPIHERDHVWTMHARNLDFQTADAVRAAIEEGETLCPHQEEKRS